MKSLNFKTACIAAVAVVFLSVNTQAQDKMSDKKDTKMSKMDHKKMDKKMSKASKMKKDTTKM